MGAAQFFSMALKLASMLIFDFCLFLGWSFFSTPLPFRIFASLFW
jgi:hypothetical protein